MIATPGKSDEWTPDPLVEKGRSWNFGLKKRSWHRQIHVSKIPCAIRTRIGAHA